MAKFRVELAIEIEVDQAVIDAVLTDEWRERFYSLHTPEDVGGHPRLGGLELMRRRVPLWWRCRAPPSPASGSGFELQDKA